MLMDLFYDEVPVEKKQRVHFHSFMLDVHSSMYLSLPCVSIIIDSMFQSSLYYPPSFYSFCHLLKMLLKPLLTFIILMTVQIVSYRYVKFPFSALTWCRRHSICHTIVFIVFLFLVMMKFHCDVLCVLYIK